MKIRDIVTRRFCTEADRRLIEALPQRLIETLFDEFYLQLATGGTSAGGELERHRRQRRKKRQPAAGPGGIGSPPPNEMTATAPAEAPAADAGGAAAAPIAPGGPTLG